MSKLRLRIHQSFDGDEGGTPRVPVTIRPLGRGVSGPRTRILAPLSETAFEPIELDPGRYAVESVLPSGEILSDDVVLDSGETKDLVLHPESSPHEWLAWQQVTGNLRSGAARLVESAGEAIARREVKRAKSKATGAKPTRKSARLRPATRGGGSSGDALRSFKSRKATRRSTRRVSENFAPAPPAKQSYADLDLRGEVDGPPAVLLLAKPHPLLASPAIGVWSWLAQLSKEAGPTILKVVNQGQETRAVPAASEESARAVYRLGTDGSTDTRVTLLGGLPEGQRRVAVVPCDARLELMSLPLPWRVLTSFRPGSVEIAVERRSEPDAFWSSMIVRDERFGPLLGYLSSGSLLTVREEAESAKELLYYKMENPLAAAAGGYALVGTAQQTEHREWHDWIQNLMRRFEWLPDGAIQWAQLKLRMRRSADDLDEAKRALKLACSRGLPFYSMGMRWLLEGLERLSKGDPELEELSRHVRQVAWMTNYRQAFTILRLGGGERV